VATPITGAQVSFAYSTLERWGPKMIVLLGSRAALIEGTGTR
jgi:hypothetical protein